MMVVIELGVICPFPSVLAWSEVVTPKCIVDVWMMPRYVLPVNCGSPVASAFYLAYCAQWQLPDIIE